MIEHGANLPALPISPETPALSPQERFRAHVEEVRTYGDACDERRTWRLGHGFKWGGVVGGIDALVTHSEHVISSAGVGIAGLTVAAITVALTREVVQSREQERAKARFKEQTQQANDAYYELYAVRNTQTDEREVAMRWFGPIENSKGASADQELARIAQLAEDSGISRLVIGQKLAACAGGGKPAGKSTTMQAWLRRYKKLDTIGPTESDLVVQATPQAWLAHAKEGAKATPTRPMTGKFLKLGPLFSEHAGLQALLQTEGLSSITLSGTMYEASNADTAETITLEVPAPQKLEPIYPYSVQEQLVFLKKSSVGFAERTKLRMRRYVAAAAAGLLVGSVSIGGAQYGADNMLGYRERQAADQIARENGVDPKGANVDPKAVRERVDSWAGMNRLWSAWRDGRDAAYSWHPSDREGQSGDLGSAGIGGRVGNINDNTKYPLWRITPHNMPDAALAGHWSMATSSTLNSSVGDTLNPARIDWDIADIYIHNTPYHVLMLPAEPDDSQSTWIEVERDINRLDRGIALNKDTYVPIPVLDDTSIIAARLNGHAVELRHNIDGTYALWLTGDETGELGKLQYWVAPSIGDGPRATEPVKVGPTAKGEPHQLPYNASNVRNIFAANLGHLDGGTPEGVEAYFTHNFTYSLEPYPRRYKFTSIDDAVATSLRLKKANCNVAATVMALALPELNPVFEFKNDTDLRVLDSSEAHARLVDRNGRSFDPTPPLPLRPRSGRPEAPAPWPVLPLAATIGAVLTGGWLVRKRRIVARQVGQVTGQLQAWSFKRAAGTFRAAQAAADHALWAREKALLDPRYLQGRRADQTMTAQDAYVALQDPERHSDAVLRTFKTQPSVTRSMRWAVLMARRVARKQV